MPALILTPRAVAPPLLQFRCGHCGIVLSVPASMAGVQGPCPSCQRLIMAPSPPPPYAPPPPADRPERPSLPATQSSATAVPAVPAPGRQKSKLREKRPAAPEQSRTSSATAGTAKDPAADEDATAGPSGTAGRRPWSWAAVGAVVGGGLVFGALSAAQLRRDVSPAPEPAAALARTPAADGEDALAALAAHKKESAGDLRALLAAQQAVWRFFAAPNAEDARNLPSSPTAGDLPKEEIHSPLDRLVLRSKRRQPEQGGLTSQWTATTTRFGELTVEVNDASGEPRVNWQKLAPQLAPASDPRTAATP